MERTATTTADAAVVWTTWADLTSWPSWTETVTSAEALGPGTGPGVGSRYRLRQPRLGRAEWTITQWEPDHRFTWESTAPGIRTVATHAVTVRPGGGADMVATLEWHGLLAPVLRLLIGRLSARYVETELASLAAHCEGRG
jgi:uncharacterized membrane protein